MLNFITVLDDTGLGTGDVEEERPSEATDREYWAKRGSESSVKMADEFFTILKEIDSSLKLSYNKYYIGVVQSNHPNNFVIFRAKKKFLRVELRQQDLEALRDKISETDMEVLSINSRNQRLRFTINKAADINKHRNLLREILTQSYNEAKE